MLVPTAVAIMICPIGPGTAMPSDRPWKNEGDLAIDHKAAQLVVLKQAAHGLLTESAEATAASTMDFLSNLENGRHY
jgi:hypothetical protein